jgi:hypothetical protein
MYILCTYHECTQVGPFIVCFYPPMWLMGANSIFMDDIFKSQSHGTMKLQIDAIIVITYCRIVTKFSKVVNCSVNSHKWHIVACCCKMISLQNTKLLLMNVTIFHVFFAILSTLVMKWNLKGCDLGPLKKNWLSKIWCTNEHGQLMIMGFGNTWSFILELNFRIFNFLTQPCSITTH